MGISKSTFSATPKDNKTLTSLACSNNRLAPVKRITLPLLKLLAALVGMRPLHYFCTATGYDINHAILWSDVTVTLGWIRSDPNRWKAFVCNRVTEIQTFMNNTQWRHCTGLDKPADHLSQRLFGDQIRSLDIWWHGSSLLVRPAGIGYPERSLRVTLSPKKKGNQAKFLQQPRLLALSTLLNSVHIGKWSVRWLGFLVS